MNFAPLGYLTLANRLFCLVLPDSMIYLPEPELSADLFWGALLFSTESSSSEDSGGETSPWSTIAFAFASFP